MLYKKLTTWRNFFMNNENQQQQEESFEQEVFNNLASQFAMKEALSVQEKAILGVKLNRAEKRIKELESLLEKANKPTEEK